MAPYPAIDLAQQTDRTAPELFFPALVALPNRITRRRPPGLSCYQIEIMVFKTLEGWAIRPLGEGIFIAKCLKLAALKRCAGRAAACYLRAT